MHAAETINNGDAGKNEKEKNHNCHSCRSPFTTKTLTIKCVCMCIKKRFRGVHNIGTSCACRRVNKVRVQCARVWIGPESRIIHYYYYFICLFPGDRPRPWVTRNWLFGLRCVWKEAADRIYILGAFVYTL